MILVNTRDLESALPGAEQPFAISATTGDGIVRLNCRPWTAQAPSLLEPAERGRPFGLAYLTPLHAGVRVEFALRLCLPEGRNCRIEVGGFATRFQRAFLVIGARGELLDQGDELADARVIPVSTECLKVRFTFRSPQTMNEWVYVQFHEVAPAGAWPEIAGFSCVPRGRNATFRGFESARRQEDGTWFALQASFFFRHYFQFDFELHRPGARLRRLELLAPVRVDSLRWLTGAPTDHDGRGMVPEAARFPLRAPGLADQLGLEHSASGQQVFGMFADPFEFQYQSMEETDAIRDFRLKALFSDGTTSVLPLCPADKEDHTILWNRLEHYMEALGGGCVLEIGGRGSASAKIRKELDPRWSYRALDIHPGENVDIVGDAHHLSSLVAPDSVDVIYSADVMEHLAAPWQFVIEANRVLKRGGLFFAMVPSAWPLHAEPWDFWRMSDHAWPGLLNPGTGFELLETGVCGRTAMVAFLPVASGRTRGQHDPAFEHTFAIARKTGAARASWNAYDPGWVAGRYEREL
jgi:hypothetical protein